MTNVVGKAKWGWLLFFISIILLGNTMLYHTPIVSPIPKEAVLGSLFDLLLLIPLLTYFFIIRKRFSIKILGFVVLAGYGVANLIIPNQYLQAYAFFPYMILGFEALFLLFELYILFKFIVFLPKIKNSFQENHSSPYFQQKLNDAVNNHIKPNRFIDVLLSEISLFYYGLFSWNKKPFVNENKYFSIHKKSGTITLYVVVIHATILESVGFHFLLHQWNPIVAWGLLVLNIYGIVFFLGEIQAIRLSPIVVEDEYVFIQVGLMKRVKIPLHVIEELKAYNGPEKLNKAERKGVFEATVKDFFNEKPSLELSLKEPIEVHYMYGIKKKVNRILLNVDEQQKFKECLNQKLH